MKVEAKSEPKLHDMQGRGYASHKHAGSQHGAAGEPADAKLTGHADYDSSYSYGLGLHHAKNGFSKQGKRGDKDYVAGYNKGKRIMKPKKTEANVLAKLIEEVAAFKGEATLKPAGPRTMNEAMQKKVNSAVEEIRHNAKEMHGGDLTKAHEEYKKKSSFGPATHEHIHHILHSAFEVKAATTRPASKENHAPGSIEHIHAQMKIHKNAYNHHNQQLNHHSNEHENHMDKHEGPSKESQGHVKKANEHLAIMKHHEKEFHKWGRKSMEHHEKILSGPRGSVVKKKPKAEHAKDQAWLAKNKGSDYNV